VVPVAEPSVLIQTNWYNCLKQKRMLFLEISCSINLESMLSRGNGLCHGMCTPRMYAWRRGHFVHTQYASDPMCGQNCHLKVAPLSFSFSGKECEAWFSITECQFNWYRRQETFQIRLFGIGHETKRDSRRNGIELLTLFFSVQTAPCSVAQSKRKPYKLGLH
jgi:hypothetical protein